MRVRVLYFGVLKDLVGVEGETVEIPDGADVSALYHHLRKCSSNEQVWSSLAVAVNREYAGLATKLHEGDEIALLPPVSGG
jgi:molybdopterin converting factor subunit 1